MFIDQCLDKVLRVRRVFESRLLLEDHCDPPAGWDSCSDGEATAFHPFKATDAYEECMRRMGE
jgi:hypothetical protein